MQAKKDVIGRCLQRLQVPLQTGREAPAEPGMPASEDVSADAIIDVGRQNPLKPFQPSSVQRAGVLMVGDRHYDILGAREAGLACAGVLYGYGSREELVAAGADYLCAFPMDVADVALGTPC